MSVCSPHILSEKRGFLGLLTLNRPQALNALTHDMVVALKAQLEAWAADEGIRAVAIRGAGARAFCAGGDIRAVQQAVIAGRDDGARLLHDEYHLNAAIGAYPKPYIALLHGYVLGGGAGVSVHGSHRIADVSLGFAMPETGIGFLPDVGGSHFLSRCPGALGMYLGLTGERIGLADALAAGLVTHAARQEDFDGIIAELAAGKPLPDLPRDAGEGVLTPQRARMDALFSATSVEDIFARLEADGSDFAQATLQTLRGKSPTALKITFRAIRAGAGMDLRQCLAMEYRLALRVIETHDFREGVRAALVDKDRNPRWNPAELAGVGDIEPFFAPLGTRELF